MPQWLILNYKKKKLRSHVNPQTCRFGPGLLFCCNGRRQDCSACTTLQPMILIKAQRSFPRHWVNLQREPDKGNSYRQLPLLCSDLFYQALFEDIKPHKLGRRDVSRKRETGNYTGERDGGAWKRGSQYLNYLSYYYFVIIICG